MTVTNWQCGHNHSRWVSSSVMSSALVKQSRLFFPRLCHMIWKWFSVSVGSMVTLYIIGIFISIHIDTILFKACKPAILCKIHHQIFFTTKTLRWTGLFRRQQTEVTQDERVHGLEVGNGIVQDTKGWWFYGKGKKDKKKATGGWLEVKNILLLIYTE